MQIYKWKIKTKKIVRKIKKRARGSIGVGKTTEKK
jgi:hypothetical protein